MFLGEVKDVRDGRIRCNDNREGGFGIKDAGRSRIVIAAGGKVISNSYTIG